MKNIIACTTALIFALWATGSAWAYGHANRWGGSTSHSWGSTSHSSAWGTSTSHTYGEGTSHTNYYGGSTSHGYYGGTTHTNAYGGTTSGAYGYGAEHTTPYGTTAYGSAYHPYGSYYGYHPPTTANYYGAGCYNCTSGWATAGAAMAGAAVGMAAGAAIASSKTSAATSNAYDAGFTAGASTASTAHPATGTYTVGQIAAVLPAGCISPEVQGKAYYLCGNTWFSAAYGANGVYYKVVPAP